MRINMLRKMGTLFALVMIASLVLTSCAAPTATPPPAPTKAPAAPQAPAAPAATAAPTKASAPAAPTAAPTVATNLIANKFTLPADAAPSKDQILRIAADDAKFIGWDMSVYDSITDSTFGMSDSCVRPDRNFNPQPNACIRWSTSADGLVWTFYLRKDKVWSDGKPITADDWVFTLQRYARADYDFEWYYADAGIVNWSDVVSGKKPAEELGAKKVDDYTFTVTTDRPVPFLVKIFADLWVAPKHVVKDRLTKANWAEDPKIMVSAGPYKLEKWEKGKEIIWTANDKYTGPFPPMNEKIRVTIMDPKMRFTAYKNNEIDIIGHLFGGDLTPAAMAEVMANADLKKQLYSWPNFKTFYLFFDTYNAPFDNLKVRQALSHAIDRDKITNGPLKYQAASAFTMNPPAFPGENVKELKSVQNYDPALAKKLFEEAGFKDGKGFPKLTLYTRNASPADTNAAEATVAMLKENLGIQASVQNLDYQTFTDKMRNQKKNLKGDFTLALVSYEFDIVDGSNLLGVWGGCAKPNATKSELPGRHTWTNAEYNKLLCEAQGIMGNDQKRNDMYKQAEKILVSDVALIPLWHSVYNALLKPNWTGPGLNPNPDGTKTLWRYRYHSTEGQIYKMK